MLPVDLRSEADLAATALALAQRATGSLSPAEAKLASQGTPLSRDVLASLRASVLDGHDPLGDTFMELRSQRARRSAGAVYTPARIIDPMVAWASDQPPPQRVVDAGAGSGRFTLAAAREFPRAQLIAVEVDPLAALVLRANLTAAGLAKRSRVIVADFRSLDLEPIRGPTLWTGNPPYVRHHDIPPHWKNWLTRTAEHYGHKASQLAGLHVHFFLATRAKAQIGDYGCFVTSAEWLDTNYGALVRQLLLDGLGGTGIHVLDPKTHPFEGTATTAVISTFSVGEKPPSLRVRRVERISDLGRLDRGRRVRRQRLNEAIRWTPLLFSAQKPPTGYVELGELCRVHRGTVTGQNGVWINQTEGPQLPSHVLVPSVTRAHELIAAEPELDSTDNLRSVVDLPVNLDELGEDLPIVERWLRWAKRKGAANSYVARNRRAWWSVGLRDPAPILATYMARRPPAFVRNLVDARHINIAHGLYPREPLSDVMLSRLADALRDSVSVVGGRTYAGGLTKFEPREMERIPVPSLELLAEKP